MGCESRKEVYTLIEEHKRRHKQTCTLRHSCIDAIANVLPHARTGKVVTTMWPVCHTKGKRGRVI